MKTIFTPIRPSYEEEIVLEPTSKDKTPKPVNSSEVSDSFTDKSYKSQNAHSEILTKKYWTRIISQLV